ncbi:acyltransferase (plasmid) [Rhizobium sp. WL3]|uniref:acyltransferase family protein n=1 Tax=Rhizobium sp. WL3 TaxID=2603277 RepID=UPI0011C1ED73|nr:acyltransferase [Rhizobium sp. WL3]QEE43652.1 acyltransferase [Rhizobium sp. WL3]
MARGLAAQFVVVGHVISAAGLPLNVTIQDLGVVLFFILSGFLVTVSALRRDSFRDYFIDRAARMFTPYIPCLIIILLMGIALDLPGPHDITTLWANIWMLQDFPGYRYLPLPEFERLGTGRQLWSVAMEWWLYMGFGAVFFASKLPLWAVPFILVGLFIAAFNATVGSLTFLWAAGALAAFVWGRLPPAPWAVLCAICSALCIYRYKIAPDEFYDVRLGLLLAVTFFTGLLAVQNVTWPRWVAVTSAAVASYSYSLYLIHYTVMVAIPGEGLIRVALVYLASNVIAVVLYWLFERHHRHVANALKGLSRQAR